VTLRCVDASFVVSWLIPSDGSAAVAEEWTAYAEGRDEYVAPPLVYPETISVIRRMAHRKLLTEREAEDLVADFLELEIPTPLPRGLYRRAYDLATRYQQPKAYDACYLAMADLLSCDLVTLDARLFNSVAGDFAGITLSRR
jgi:predicted nucleic acid-binding protein